MTRGWTVAFATGAIDNVGLIEARLARAYHDFGENPAGAARYTEVRIEVIVTGAKHLAAAPFRGAAQDDLMLGLRYLALDSAVRWFVPDADRRQFKVLAMVFGGQDHQRHMLLRLLRRDRP